MEIGKNLFCAATPWFFLDEMDSCLSTVVACNIFVDNDGVLWSFSLPVLFSNADYLAKTLTTPSPPAETTNRPS